MITRINKSKTLAKHTSCRCKCKIKYKCKYKIDGRKCNSNQKWDSDKRRCECK